MTVNYQFRKYFNFNFIKCVENKEMQYSSYCPCFSYIDFIKLKLKSFELTVFYPNTFLQKTRDALIDVMYKTYYKTKLVPPQNIRFI